MLAASMSFLSTLGLRDMLVLRHSRKSCKYGHSVRRARLARCFPSRLFAAELAGRADALMLLEASRQSP